MEHTRNLIRKLFVLLIGVGTLAGAFIGVAPAAHAALPKGQGYGWLTRYPGGQVSSYSSSNQPATLSHLGTGRWRATFAGLPANPTGVAMVSPGMAAFGGTCALEQWYGQSLLTRAGTKTGVVVELHCADRLGNLVDGDFSVSFTSVSGHNEGWVLSGGPALANPAKTYNWTGDKVDVFKTGAPGNYGVGYHGFAVNGGVAMTTAVDPQSYDRRCDTLPASSQPSPAVTTMPIACHHANGTSAAATFASHFVYGRGLFADASLLQGYAVVDGPLVPKGWADLTAPASFSSTGGGVHVTRLFAGLYQVKFDGLAGSTRMVHVNTNAAANADIRCTADTTSTASTDGIVTVLCVHGDQTVADTKFSIAYSAKA